MHVKAELGYTLPLIRNCTLVPRCCVAQISALPDYLPFIVVWPKLSMASLHHIAYGNACTMPPLPDVQLPSVPVAVGFVTVFAPWPIWPDTRTSTTESYPLASRRYC